MTNNPAVFILAGLLFSTTALAQKGFGGDFLNSMIGESGGVQVKTCRHPIFTGPNFKTATLSCGILDSTFLEFKRSWDLFSILNSIDQGYKLVDLTPWREIGNDGEYQRIYELDGHRLLVSYLPSGDGAELTMLLNPEGGGSGKSTFTDVYRQDRPDPANFNSTVKTGIVQFASKNNLRIISCPKTILNDSDGTYEVCFSTANSLDKIKKLWLTLNNSTLQKAGDLKIDGRWDYVNEKKAYLNLSFIGDSHALLGSYFPKLAGQKLPVFRIVLASLKTSQ